jgi:hypothetical protein
MSGFVMIKKGNDPFKKYWWVILFGFAGVGAWICLPLMDTSVGSGSVRAHGLKAEPQSLDSMTNPSGAAGAAYDLSMDGAAGKKRAESEPTSSLYQAPPEAQTGAAAPGAPVAAASFADALKEVSQKTAASSSWGGATPQKGFTPPKGNFSALSGLSSGGGGSGASWSPGVSQNLFGSNVAKTALVAAHGLGAGDGASSPGAKPIMGALKAAASQGQSAVVSKSADASRAASGMSFDGSHGGAAIGGGSPSAAAGGSFANLDAVPANLKPKDPDLDPKIGPVPGAPVPDTNQKQQMMQAIMMMLITAVVGGVASAIVNLLLHTNVISSNNSRNSAGRRGDIWDKDPIFLT